MGEVEGPGRGGVVGEGPEVGNGSVLLLGLEHIFGGELGVFASRGRGDDGAFEPEVDDQPGSECGEEDCGSAGKDLAQGVDVRAVVDVGCSHCADVWGVEEEDAIGESVDGRADRCDALP